MGYQLRMTAEIAEWLGDLRESDPITAIEVGAALAALMEAAEVASLAFVTGTDDTAIDDPRERLDYAYQRMLEVLQRLRRKGAEVATLRKHLEMQVSDTRATAEPGAELADLEGKLAAAQRREEALAAQLQRVQGAVDYFRSAKESAKAVFTSADAQRRIQDALLAAGIEEEGKTAAVDRAAEVKAAELKADDVLAEASRLLRSAMAAAGLRAPAAYGATAAADGPPILQLHADPLVADVRVLFAIVPPGTATLLAVLEGEAVIRAHGEEAIDLARSVASEIRDAGWSAEPDDTVAGGPEFTEAATFLAECFPSQAAAVSQRAAALASAVTLRDLRGDRDLAAMERSADICEDRLRRIDGHGLQVASVREAAAYVRALGGRLDVTVSIDGAPSVPLA